ncbi:1,4-alpha-glucan branching protein GlgB [Candidatus Auribacterota bacterium]
MNDKNNSKNEKKNDGMLVTDYDTYLFREGNHHNLYEKLGSHVINLAGIKGTYFAVWAPNAEYVSVIGDFNAWDKNANPMNIRWDGSGVWEMFIPGIGKGIKYKYHIRSKYKKYKVDKADPFSIYDEKSPGTASIVWDLKYKWNDRGWMEKRGGKNSINGPFSVYEMHLGSWRRCPEDNNRYLTYREMAPLLAEYVKSMGFTHVEFLPVMEHPFYGSWGYQVTGFFAPTSRYGTPQDLMFLIDHLHQNGIGVILDWVPSHFPGDEHGLVYFDGTHLFEHSDPRQGFHPEWKSYIFNCGRNEVRNFLISSALYWLRVFHIDCLRVDAVASMLYLDYARKKGEWIPNEHGGRENTQSIFFLKNMNEVIYQSDPDVQTIAEESTAWPMVSKPTYVGGLGFGMKWNMGWMHDTLDYMSLDPIYRKYHHNQLSFGIWYAFSENFMLPLSHDEVVYGKGSLIGKMSGDPWQKFSNLKLLFGFMYAHPGKKLIFMGGEFGQWAEWNHDRSLDWHLLDYPYHQGIQQWVKDVNKVYRSEPALYERDFQPDGFKWIDFRDWESSVVSFMRISNKPGNEIIAVFNFTPIPRHNYKLGVPTGGFWRELLNSDAGEYKGSCHGNYGGVEALPVPSHGYLYSVDLTLPPLGAVFLKKQS